MDWYLRVLRNYAGFEGRARRAEYWFFTLFNVLIAGALFLLSKVAGILIVLYLFYALAVLIPALAVSVRRLHDTGRSGFWVLIALIPILGGITLLIFMCLPGQAGQNKFGPAPQ